MTKKKENKNTITVNQSNKLETVFEMVEIYSNELDRVAFYLLECDNPEELRAYEAEEKGE